MADQLGGFDCEFIEKPPKEIQSTCKCPVCELLLREPHQANCCGSRFCQLCIQQLIADKKSCPCCGEKTFTNFEDKGHKKSLYNFKVWCINKSQGCTWEGELMKLEKHLKRNPTNEEQLRGCEFVEVNCLYCSEFIQRSKILVHQSDKCPRRPFSCEFCNDFHSYHDDVTKNHYLKCGDYPQLCPNKCGREIPQKSIVHHIRQSCPLARIDCEFKYVGCEMRLPRKDMPAHISTSMAIHISLLKSNNKHLLEENQKLEQQVAEQKQQIVKQTQDIQALQSQTPMLCPIQFVMTDFEKHKIECDPWHSSPFYTHPKGYKMCLCVTANGQAKGAGTHTSIHIYLMRGEFDDQLKWPFRGDITIKLLNQEGDEGHHEKTVGFNNDTHDKTAGRVIEGEVSEGGRGFSTFISHINLQLGYLKNDCLIVHITDVVLK